MMSKIVSSNTVTSSGSGILPGTKVTKDQVQTPSSQSTAPVQPLVSQSKTPTPISETVVAPVSAPMPNLKSTIPYPSRRDNERRRDQANEQIKKFYEIFKDMSFEISFTDALILMPKFASTLKALIGNKEKLSEMARTPMNEHCSAVILNKLQRNLGDPGKFLIPCEFPGMDECLALVDLDQDRETIAKSFTLPRDSAPRVTSLLLKRAEVEIIRLKERVKILEDKEGVIGDRSGDDAPIKGRSNNEGEAAAERKSNDSEEIARAQKEEIRRLKERVQVLEDKEGVATKQSGEDAPIKGRSDNEGEVAVERISNDSEDIARVLTSMDASTVLAGEIDVPTGSGFIPTAGPIVTRRKGKEVMVESDTPKKKKLQEQIDAQVARELEEQQEREDMRMNEQIARYVEVARIHAEEEIQGMIESLDTSNETIAKYLQEYQEFASELPLEKKIELISDLVKYQEHYTKVHKFQSQQRKPMTKKQKREYYMTVIKSNLGWRFNDFKGMTFEEIEVKFAEVWKQVEDFIPMGSKEETERLKRKGLNLEKEQVKKQKSLEEAPEIETTTKEFPEEKIKEMMQLVSVEDV
nr:reverse transcriptase domain-containing protein [Tanacetum cinerariifolium]